jgi:hypothetical protein
MRLPGQDHPYRTICDLRAGAAASLIELDFASHTGEEGDTNPRVPAGLPFYSLRAQLRELELVFLNRFLQVRATAAALGRCWVSDIIRRVSLGWSSQAKVATWSHHDTWHLQRDLSAG